MSPHVQPLGQGEAGAGGFGGVPGAPTTTESIVKAAAVPFRPEVAARPATTLVGIVTDAALPGISV